MDTERLAWPSAARRSQRTPPLEIRLAVITGQGPRGGIFGLVTVKSRDRRAAVQHAVGRRAIMGGLPSIADMNVRASPPPPRHRCDRHALRNRRLRHHHPPGTATRMGRWERQRAQDGWTLHSARTSSHARSRNQAPPPVVVSAVTGRCRRRPAGQVHWPRPIVARPPPDSLCSAPGRAGRPLLRPVPRPSCAGSTAGPAALRWPDRGPAPLGAVDAPR
jgi:hypothetical protein